MPDAVVNIPPAFITHPYIHLGTVGSGVEFACACTNLTMEPSQDEKSSETFCGVYSSYGAEKWTITATVSMSYGTNGVWNTLRPLVNTVVPFEVRPGTAVAGPTNPSATGTGFVKAFPFIDAAPGEASEVDIEIACQGIPTWALALTQEAEEPAA